MWKKSSTFAADFGKDQDLRTIVDTTSGKDLRELQPR